MKSINEAMKEFEVNESKNPLVNPDRKDKKTESDDNFYNKFGREEYKVRFWTDKKGKIENDFKKELKKFMKDFSKKHKGEVPEIEDIVSSFPVIL